MFSLIIVEDELFMADFLENFVDWESIGVTIAGVFHDGTSALSAILENEPNVVLTDINMPVMNGLELIEKAQQNNVKTKFVVISGYNDFYLVKKAFKLGVNDYFLKTELDPNELKNFVLKMKLIDEMNVFKTDINIKEPILKNIVWGMRSVKEYQNKLPLHIFRYKLMLVLDLVNYETILNQYQGDKELLKYGIQNILDEILSQVDYAECFFDDYDRLAFLISDENKEQAVKNVYELAEVIRKSLADSLKLETEGGFCGITESEKELAGLCDKARYAAKFSFVRGRESIYDYTQLAKENGQLHMDKSKAIIAFENLVFDFEFDDLNERIEEFIVHDATIHDLDSVVEMYRSYFVVLAHFSNKYEEFSFESGCFERIVHSGTLAELNDYFTDIVRQLAELFGYSTNVAVQVKKYIQENYANDISLQTVADTFQINYKKLSRLFLQKTGQSFKKYLTDVRMQEAMRLIKDTDFLLYEISEMVGYNNYANFSRSFMKYYDKWPKDIERG